MSDSLDIVIAGAGLATREASAPRELQWSPPHRLAGVRLPAFLALEHLAAGG